MTPKEVPTFCSAVYTPIELVCTQSSTTRIEVAQQPASTAAKDLPNRDCPLDKTTWEREWDNFLAVPKRG